ncbi:MAG: peptide ABC transporter substrate-binding protein [Bacteroidota bacterium]
MKRIIPFSLLLFILFSCAEDKKTFEHAGGVFKMCLNDFPSTNIAREVTDVHSSTVMSQVMEGLVSFNSDHLKVVPQIAESWSVSNDNLKYTFKIRKDVLFHECDLLSSEGDRRLTPDDIVSSFEMACKKDKTGNPTSAYASFFKGTIKGVDDFHEGKTKTIAGLKIQENTLTITLEQVDANFLNKIASINASISSKKIIEANQEDLMIGTGPFVYAGLDEKAEKPKITLKKNEDYYMQDKDGNSLPYLDGIEFIVETKKLDELEMFENGETHFISALPTSRISEMLEGRMKDFNAIPPVLILRNNPLLATNYYFFNMEDPRFQDVRVRQAFNYAIDRNEITQNVLRGQAYENGIYGIVPPISSSFRGYDFKGVKEVSYDFNPEKAKQLLAEAGFPNGTGFGSVNLRLNVGDVHSAVAEEIASQLSQTLGINVNLDASSFEQRNIDASNGKGDLFRSAWFGDYVSPETFLVNFYGKIVPKSKKDPSVVNQSRYRNAKFDELFEAAKKESNLKKSLTLFAEAEKELMKNPPLMVLWYNGDIQLLYSKVRNFNENPLNHFILKEVYFKDWTKTEYENKVKS